MNRREWGACREGSSAHLAPTALAALLLRLTELVPSYDVANMVEQSALLSANDFTYLGNRTLATEPEPGWRMAPILYLKCTPCGYCMSHDPKTYDGCFFG